MSEFEEWYKAHYTGGLSTTFDQHLKSAWDAAIDEAVKVAEDSEHLGECIYYLKELKK